MKTHIASSFHLDVFENDLEEFEEIQDRLNTIRLEIIPILEKQLKRVPLEEDEKSKFMVYNDLEGRLHDLRLKNKRGDDEKMFWLYTDKIKLKPTAIPITIDNIREDTIEDYNYLEFEIVDPNEKPLNQNMQLIKIAPKKECETLAKSYKNLNSKLHEVREKDFSLLELFYIKFKSAGEYDRATVETEIGNGNKDLETLMLNL